MASIFLQDPIYITVAQVKDTTDKEWLSALSDDDVKVLIYKAQREVDTYLGATFRPPFEEDQDFLFPVEKDDASYLPTGITEATFYVVEQVYESGDTVSGNISQGDIIEETTWPHTVKYDGGSEFSWYLIPDIAKKLLDNYRNIFTWQTL